MLTPKRLREILHYDSTTGVFTWAVRTSNCINVGEIAGALQNKSYWHIRADGGSYQAHRLAWLYIYDEWPKGEIDHIDGNRLNNRIANLRDVSNIVNQQNQRRAQRHNKTGFLGVSPHLGKFHASIRIDGKKTHLGSFDSPELAHAAYVNAKRVHHEGCTI